MSNSTKPQTSASEASEKRQLLHHLLTDCPELRQLEKQIAAFNIFNVLRLGHAEIRHSNMLAWLLRPEESHGLGDLFLRRWLIRVFSQVSNHTPSSLDPVDLDGIKFASVEVKREWNYIDLLIIIETSDAAQWIITIENKIWSGQRENQLLNYLSKVESTFPKAAKRCYIFLTHRKQSPEHQDYTPTNYNSIYDTLQECLTELNNVLGEEPRIFLEHYLALLRESFMENSDIKKLAKTIYKNHKRALDIIFQSRPDEIANLTERLEEDFLKKEADRLGLVPMICKKPFVRFIPKIWDTAINRSGDAWGSEKSAHVLFEIELSTVPLLKIVNGKTAKPLEKWRRSLWDLAKSEGFIAPNKHEDNPPDQWAILLSKTMPYEHEHNLRELDDSDIEEVAERIWDWIKEQLKTEEVVRAQEKIGWQLDLLADSDKNN